MQNSGCADFFLGGLVSIGLWALLWMLLLSLPKQGGLWAGAALVAITVAAAVAISRKRAYFAAGLVAAFVAPVLALYACVQAGGWG